MPPRPPVPPSRARANSRRTPDFMKYPHPETGRILAHLETLPVVKDESKRCIANLLEYRAVRTRARLPRGQSSAVLVPLFVGRSGDLYVLLSRRSDALKAFSGDTALPGGKIDAEDLTVEDTARREAFEEVGLPQDKERVPLLCVMEPHLAKGEILVTPVVVLVLDNSLQPNLNSSEVTSIFAQPLPAFLSSTPYFSSSRTANPNHSYYTFTDIPWSDGGAVRLHRFLTGREAEGVKPVFGLTASILIKTATIGYGRLPDFEVQPPNAPTPAQQIALALLTPSNPLRIACEREGVDANRTAARLLRPPVAANAARTIEWEKIGLKWKKLMDGDSVDAVVDKGKRVSSGWRPDLWDRNPGKRIEGIEKQTQDQVKRDGERMEGPGTKVGEYETQACEHEEQTEESNGEQDEPGEQDAILDMAKLGEFLDKTRDMVNERMKEVKGDDKKLAKARRAYPKIAEQVKKQLEKARNEDGESDLKALFAMIPKDSQEGLEGDVKASEDGAERSCMDDGEEKFQGTQRRKGTSKGRENTRRYIAERKNGYDPKQVRKKRNAKL